MCTFAWILKYVHMKYVHFYFLDFQDDFLGPYWVFIFEEPIAQIMHWSSDPLFCFWIDGKNINTSDFLSY